MTAPLSRTRATIAVIASSAVTVADTQACREAPSDCLHLLIERGGSAEKLRRTLEMKSSGISDGETTAAPIEQSNVPFGLQLANGNAEVQLRHAESL